MPFVLQFSISAVAVEGKAGPLFVLRIFVFSLDRPLPPDLTLSSLRNDEKFNEHFRALSLDCTMQATIKCSSRVAISFPDAITRSRIFCDHLSQCAMVVGVLQGLRNARERAMYSTRFLGQCTLGNGHTH